MTIQRRLHAPHPGFRVRRALSVGQRITTLITLLYAILSSACSGDGSVPIDAGPDAWVRGCWYGEGTPTDGTSVTLGEGLDSFTPIVDEQTLLIHHGPQGGSHFELNARITGMYPGDLSDNKAPSPYTLITGYTEDGELVTSFECTFPGPYEDIGGGMYQLATGRVIVLKDQAVSGLNGQRVRLLVRVMDPQNRYAETEHWVVAEDTNAP